MIAHYQNARDQRVKTFFLLWLLLTFAGPIWMMVSGKVDLKADYRTANRDSAHLAPNPATTREAVIQVYSARAFNWRGAFAVHSWIAVKAANAEQYTVYQVVGWRLYYDHSALAIENDIPDRNWYDQKPQIILDIRGDKAEKLIPKIDKAAQAYPYANTYTLWPGPNSNTFPAYIARAVPELGLAMPADALGKDFLSESTFFAPAPSDTGYQFSLFGAFGLLIAKKEGVEINLLGVVYGFKFKPFSLLIPGFGQLF